MLMSKKFGEPSIIHEGIYYFANGFTYLDRNVNSRVAYRIGNRWVRDNIKITFDLANELIDYADGH